MYICTYIDISGLLPPLMNTQAYQRASFADAVRLLEAVHRCSIYLSISLFLSLSIYIYISIHIYIYIYIYIHLYTVGRNYSA